MFYRICCNANVKCILFDTRVVGVKLSNNYEKFTVYGEKELNIRYSVYKLNMRYSVYKLNMRYLVHKQHKSGKIWRFFVFFA